MGICSISEGNVIACLPCPRQAGSRQASAAKQSNQLQLGIASVKNTYLVQLFSCHAESIFFSATTEVISKRFFLNDMEESMVSFLKEWHLGHVPLAMTVSP